MTVRSPLSDQSTGVEVAQEMRLIVSHLWQKSGTDQRLDPVLLKDLSRKLEDLARVLEVQPTPEDSFG
jgi:hypothetical protein